MPPKKASRKRSKNQPKVTKKKAKHTNITETTPAPRIRLKVTPVSAPIEVEDDEISSSSTDICDDDLPPPSPASISASASAIHATHRVRPTSALGHATVATATQSTVQLADSRSTSPEPKSLNVAIEMRVFLDDEEVFGKEYWVDILNPFSKRLPEFRDIASREVDEYIEEHGFDASKRIPKYWWIWYGAKTNPTQSRIRHGNDTEYAELLDIVRERKSNWLLLQVVFGLRFNPTDLPRPEYHRPKMVVDKKGKEKAAPKRVFDDVDPPPVLNKRSTTTSRMLAELEASNKAVQGTEEEYITSIQTRWPCKRSSCSNVNRFCWVEDEVHYGLSVATLHTWAQAFKAKTYGVTLESPPEALQIELRRQERRDRQDRAVREQQSSRRQQGGKSSLLDEYNPVLTQYTSPVAQTHINTYPPPPSQPYWGYQNPPYPQSFPPPFISIQQEPTSWNSPRQYQPVNSPLVAPQLSSNSLQPVVHAARNNEVNRGRFSSPVQPSSPVAEEVEVEKQLTGLKRFLDPLIPSHRRPGVNLVIRAAEEQMLDLDQLKGLKPGEAKDLGMPLGPLSLVKKQISQYKKTLKSELLQTTSQLLEEEEASSVVVD